MVGHSEQCPVCGMEVKDRSYPFEYSRVFYHFCSEQCRDMFRAHPRLYFGKRSGRHREMIRSRTLPLAGTWPPEVYEQVERKLGELMGVQAVHIDDDGLVIRYDLLQVTLARIESTLAELGVVLDNGWWQRARRAWMRTTEANALDNLATPGTCCNKPPHR